MMEIDYSTFDFAKNGLPDDVGEVIKLLEAKFPDRLPDTTPTPYEIGSLIGEQNVVRFLKTFYKGE